MTTISAGNWANLRLLEEQLVELELKKNSDFVVYKLGYDRDDVDKVEKVLISVKVPSELIDQ